MSADKQIILARNGSVIGDFSEAEFNARLKSGEILPSDDCYSKRIGSWIKVHEYLKRPPAVPIPPVEYEPVEFSEAASIIAEMEDVRSLPQRPRPAKCPHCGAGVLRSAYMLWSEGSRTGVSVDMNLRPTLYLSQNHLAARYSPPSEHDGKTRQLSSMVIFVLSFGLVGIPMMTIPAMIFIGNPIVSTEGSAVILRVLILVWLGLIFWLTTKVATWLYRRSIVASAKKGLRSAEVYDEWKNTWICTSCGKDCVV